VHNPNVFDLEAMSAAAITSPQASEPPESTRPVPVVDPKLGLLRKPDVNAYSALLKAVRDGRSVLFLGAGPSSPLYGTWDDIVEDLLDQARLVPLPGETVFRTVDRCQQRLRPKGYADVLLGRFGRKPAGAPGTVYSLLVQADFDAFVTTNFDCCLDYAGDDQGGITGTVYSYPDDFSVANIGHRCIFHIHGRIVPGNTNADSMRVVLSESDYRQAYEERSELRVLISELLCHSDRTVVFYGTGFRDHTLLFDSIRHGHEQLRKTIAMLREDGRDARPRTHYAFISVPAFPPGSQHGLAYWQESVDARLTEIDSILRQYRPEIEVVPILYADPNPGEPDMRHYFLTEILRDMKRVAPYQGGAPVAKQGTG